MASASIAYFTVAFGSSTRRNTLNWIEHVSYILQKDSWFINKLIVDIKLFFKQIKSKKDKCKMADYIQTL